MDDPEKTPKRPVWKRPVREESATGGDLNACPKCGGHWRTRPLNLFSVLLASADYFLECAKCGHRKRVAPARPWWVIFLPFLLAALALAYHFLIRKG